MATSSKGKSSLTRERYDKSNRSYVVFVGSLLIHFIAMAMPSAMLGIVYVDVIREFKADASWAALMQSLYRGIVFGGGVVAELVIRRVGEFPCMMAGSLLGSLSFLAAAFAENVTTIVLLIGVGGVFLSYVNVRRAFYGDSSAAKFLTSITIGAGMGFLVTPYMIEFFLREFGWRGTFMIAGGIFFHLVLIGVAVKLNLPPLEDPTESKDFKWRDQVAVFKKRGFSVYMFDVFLFGMFGFAESWFLPDFLVSNNYTKEDAVLLLTVSGVFNLAGRILAVPLSSFFSRPKILYHWSYICLALALSHALYPFFLQSYPVLIVASGLYGICFGVLFSQGGPIVLQSLPLDLYPIGMATDLTFYGVSSAFGGYIGGFIRDITGGYDGVFYVASISSIICSFASLLLIPMDKLYKKKDGENVHKNPFSIISHL
ncbi:monocarboxylate transporter 2-like isoform X2 [Ostrea edulis]|uniref:monocarboxylate transporter 2-like isoform X2 n=1 Tax=Ostrea edulis TaxID=37623 RepID=UPI0024AED957|nr:monocarboxylate transporter 2-like isoform X2 [Ostrea edulis]